MTSIINDAFKVLANPVRRQLLCSLTKHDHQSVQLRGYPRDNPFEVSNRERLQLGLRHTHLPMLEQAEFIDWHIDDQEITRGSNFHVIRPLLSHFQLGGIQEHTNNAR